MDFPFRLLQPFLGPRIIKTGLAVFLSLAIFHWFGSGYATFAAVAAILAVQPTIHQAREVFRQQLLGNVVAGVIAASLGIWLPITPLTMSVGTVLVLGLLNRLKLSEASGLAVVVVIFIMDRPEKDFLPYTLARLGTIVGGMAIGFLVNRYIRPPDVFGRARLEIAECLTRTDGFLHQLAVSLASPGEYPKDAIKQEAAAIQRHVGTARTYLEFVANDANQQRVQTLKKANASMAVFAEAVMDIHKLALELGGLTDEAERSAVTGALRAVQRYAQSVMQAALAQGQPDPEAAAGFEDALAALRERVELLVDRREERQRGLLLHGIFAEIRHMGWRMASLSRLLG